MRTALSHSISDNSSTVATVDVRQTSVIAAAAASNGTVSEETAEDRMNGAIGTAAAVNPRKTSNTDAAAAISNTAQEEAAEDRINGDISRNISPGQNALVAANALHTRDYTSTISTLTRDPPDNADDLITTADSIERITDTQTVRRKGKRQKCRYCRRFGHRAKDCRIRRRNQQHGATMTTRPEGREIADARAGQPAGFREQNITLSSTIAATSTSTAATAAPDAATGGSQGGKRDKGPTDSNHDRRDRNRKKCSYCERLGHIAENCFIRRHVERHGTAPARKSDNHGMADDNAKKSVECSSVATSSSATLQAQLVRILEQLQNSNQTTGNASGDWQI